MTDTADPPIAAPAVEAITRRQRRRRRLLRVIGSGLIAYGAVGLLLLAVVGSAVAAPINELGDIATSVEEQRTAALDALRAAGETIDQTASAVQGMDASLAEAKAATDRASTISTGVATSMAQLASAMSLTIFGVQPLIGLQPGFADSSAQLTLLALDLTSIGAALEANRDDTVLVGQSLQALSESLDALRTAVGAGPQLEAAAASIDALRLGVLALLVWLGVLALGSILAGAACWMVARG